MNNIGEYHKLGWMISANIRWYQPATEILTILTINLLYLRPTGFKTERYIVESEFWQIDVNIQISGWNCYKLYV